MILLDVTVTNNETEECDSYSIKRSELDSNASREELFSLWLNMLQAMNYKFYPYFTGEAIESYHNNFFRDDVDDDSDDDEDKEDITEDEDDNDDPNYQEYSISDLKMEVLRLKADLENSRLELSLLRDSLSNVKNG
jgi:hypothetical protein